MIPSDRDGIWGPILAVAAALVLAAAFWTLGLPRFATTAGRRATLKVVLASHVLGAICVAVFLAVLIAVVGVTSLSDYLKGADRIFFLSGVGGVYFVLSALCGILWTLRLDRPNQKAADGGRIGGEGQL
jgi:hypothetical protein